MRLLTILAYIILAAAVAAAPWLMNAAFEHYGVFKMLPPSPYDRQKLAP